MGALLSMGLVIGVAGGAGARPATKSMAPTVKSVVPDHGSVNGGTLVTVTGKNLITASAVSFGGVPGVIESFKRGGSIEATAPAGTSTVDVTVTTPDGTSNETAADSFTYVTTPAIQNLSPRIGASYGGTRVIISGSDFSGVTGVSFGDTAAASFVIDSPQAITAVTSAESVGQVAVSLTGTDGDSPSDPADLYTFALRVPKVTFVSPATGSDAGGTAVVITGTGFNKKTTTTVDFGSGNPGTGVTVKNSRTIDVTSPAGSGVVDVTVTDTKKGTSSLNPTFDQFSYTDS
jgi:hypothetical protein